MSRKKGISTITIGIAIIVIVAAVVGGYFATRGGGGGGGGKGKVKNIAVVLGNPMGDKGFTDTTVATFRRLDQMNDDLKVKIFEPSKPWATGEYRSYFTNAADSGKYDLIVGGVISTLSVMKEVAPQYPDQHFVQLDAYAWSDNWPNNITVVNFKQNEASFMGGVLAAEMSDTNKIGFMGGDDAPSINDWYKGYKAGAEWVNPDIQVITRYAGGHFGDPALGKELTLELYNAGADVVFPAAAATSLGTFQAAKEENKYAIGVDVDQCYIAPNHMIGSVLKGWEYGIESLVKTFMAGKLEKDSLYLVGVTTNLGGVGMCGMGTAGCKSKVNIPQEVRDKVKEAQQKVANGEIDVPGALDWSEWEKVAKKFVTQE